MRSSTCQVSGSGEPVAATRLGTDTSSRPESPSHLADKSHQRPELIERIAGSVVARLGTPPQSQAQGEKRYVREKEAAAFLGVSVSALRSWRSKRSPSEPPVTRIDRMVFYSMKGLEQFMQQRTVERR